MSIFQFLTSGGMCTTSGDLSDNDKKVADSIVRNFAEKVVTYGRRSQVSASILNVQQCNFLFVAKDSRSFHFVLSEMPGHNTIIYRNLSSHGRLELQSITRQIDIEVGTPIWAFSCFLNIPEIELESYIDKIAKEYVDSVLHSQKKANKQISEEAISNPEIATGIEKFRQDYPAEQKTAFIIIKFRRNDLRNDIVSCIKNVLSECGIVGLRADDKEYMDDLLSNIRVYMNVCDFGIGIYERIDQDDFNPNVSLEVGYMMGKGKNVLLLKDSTLKALQTDLAGKLYKEFDVLKINETLPQQIKKWLSDKGLHQWI